MSDECGFVESSCICVLPFGHETPHVCSCGGSFAFDERGVMTVYAFPNAAAGFGGGGLNLTQEEAIEKANEYVAAGPRNMGDALVSFLGGWDDEDEDAL